MDVESRCFGTCRLASILSVPFVLFVANWSVIKWKETTSAFEICVIRFGKRLLNCIPIFGMVTWRRCMRMEWPTVWVRLAYLLSSKSLYRCAMKTVRSSAASLPICLWKTALFLSLRLPGLWPRNISHRRWAIYAHPVIVTLCSSTSAQQDFR